MRTLKKYLSLLLLLPLFTGCASFERDWRHAVTQPPPQKLSPTGAWQGRWVSNVNGHTGDIRCIVTDKGADRYEFRFKATYWKVFRYSYVVTMPVRCETEHACEFQGEEDLGFLAGGTYRYDGTLTQTNLTANYHCKYDQGVFLLKRN